MTAGELESVLQPDIAIGVSSAQELLDFLDDGIIELIGKKQDPYYTIAKNRLVTLLTEESYVTQSYVDKMIYTLNGLILSLGEGDSSSFEKSFVEICLGIIKSPCPYLLSKSTLRILNHINKKTP